MSSAAFTLTFSTSGHGKKRGRRCISRERCYPFGVQRTSYRILMAVLLLQVETAAWCPIPFSARKIRPFIRTGLYESTETDLENSIHTDVFASDDESFWVNGGPQKFNGATAERDDLPDFLKHEEIDVPLPTENGGYSHTQQSRAKISAANKGKVPWNKGKTRPEETKARIAAGVRARNRERFLQKLKDMGMTEEEYERKRKEEKRKREAERRARRTAKGGYRPTEETRKKLSKILKEKYAKGEVKPRKIDLSKVRRGFIHSEETRQKISESLRKRWAEDPEYRARMVAVSKKSNAEAKDKIRASLRRKWEDPEFRSKMLEKRKVLRKRQTNKTLNEEHRRRISEAMKKKWQDEEYRKKTEAGISKGRASMGDLPTKSPSKSRGSRRAKPESPVTLYQSGVGVVEVVTPLSEPRKIKKVKKKKVTKRATQAFETDTATSKVPASADSGETTKGTTTSSKKADHKGGDVDLLKEERRDLYDLLYGDEDDLLDSLHVYDDDGSSLASFFTLEDDNLDTFDPYGLEDF